MDSPVPPLSPYLIERPKDLSESLAGADPEGDESRDRRLKLGKLIPGQDGVVQSTMLIV